MNLVSTFQALVHEISWVMTAPTFQSFLVVLAGWLFTRRRTVTGTILAAGRRGEVSLGLPSPLCLRPVVGGRDGPGRLRPDAEPDRSGTPRSSWPSTTPRPANVAGWDS